MIQPAAHRKFDLKDWVICLLLLLATVHCVRSIFLVNISFINLQQYGEGQERMPYQGRVNMMPLVHWAHHNAYMQHLSAFFEDSLEKSLHTQTPPDRVTPEKMVCILTGLAATLLATLYCIWFGAKRFGRAWWVPATLMLAILYVTYAARYEVEFWYPYDLPHFALFGIAAACILDDMWALAFLLFLVDAPMRETAIFLLPPLLAVGYSRGKIRPALAWGAAMLAVWIPIRLLIMHHFAGHRSEVGIHWHSIAVSILNPLHWPQIASAFAFLLLPFCFGWKYLNRDQRFFVFGMLPCLPITLLFGVWYETRIWDEWMIPAAILLTFQFLAYAQTLFQSSADGERTSKHTIVHA